MKRAIKIIKSYWIIDVSGYNNLYLVSLIIFAVIEILACSLQTMEINDYLSRNININFTNFIFQLTNLMIFSYVFGLNFYNQRNINNKKSINNSNSFLLQLPVYKKDLFNARFLMTQVVSFVPLLMVVYIIILNLFTGASNYISAYTGVMTVIYCVWIITFCLSAGFQLLQNKKYRNLTLVSIIFIIFFMLISFANFNNLHNADLNIYNMYDDFGKIFAPAVKACIPIGRLWGIPVIVISNMIAYILGSVVPLKISQKEG